MLTLFIYACPMPRLDTRREELLSFVIRQHAATAEPVASEIVKDKAGLGVSPATIRNEMAALEKAGYLRQPHTSAGRVPTEDGYRYFITHCLEEKDVGEELGALREAMRGAERGEDSSGIKRLAKELASTVEEGVFVGFAPSSTFYTGLSYLFDQPEFESVDLVRHLGEIIDNLDRIVAELFEEVVPGVKVYVGSENPFGSRCGTVLLRGGSDQPMMGVLGPMRMDYDRMVAMMRELEKVLWTN